MHKKLFTSPTQCTCVPVDRPAAMCTDYRNNSWLVGYLAIVRALHLVRCRFAAVPHPTTRSLSVRAFRRDVCAPLTLADTDKIEPGVAWHQTMDAPRI